MLKKILTNVFLGCNLKTGVARSAALINIQEVGNMFRPDNNMNSNNINMFAACRLIQEIVVF